MTAMIVSRLDQLVLGAAGSKATELVKIMKRDFGTRCLPVLIALIEDEDTPISAEAILSQFRITSQVKALSELVEANMVVDHHYRRRLQEKAFWVLELHHCRKHYDELLTCFPDRFEWLKRHFGNTS